MDKTILIGAADLGRELTLTELAGELAEVLGFELEKQPDQDLFHGGSDAAHAWLQSRRRDEEPFVSHPFVLDLAYPDGPPLPYLNGLFDRLSESGRYRLILLIDHDCVRSTHFPCEQW